MKITRLLSPEPGAAGGGAPAAGGNGGAPAGAPATPVWTDGFSADDRGFVQSKGFADPGQLLNSYRNLEKLMGAGPADLLRMPKDDKPESWDPVYARLGRPAAPGDYKLAKFEGMPDEASAAKFNDFLRNTFHGLGLTAKQAEGITGKWADFVRETISGQETALEQQALAEQSVLRGEWGPNYDRNVNIARSAASALGLAPEHVDQLEDALGFGQTMKFLASVGSRMGEADYVDGGSRPGFDVQDQESAMAEINTLKVDVEFAKKLTSGDAEAKARWDRLHMIAFPDAA